MCFLVCMCHWMCALVCVVQREVTHETVTLLFFHLLQCSGLSWQGGCATSLWKIKLYAPAEGRQGEGGLREKEGKEDGEFLYDRFAEIIFS